MTKEELQELRTVYEIDQLFESDVRKILNAFPRLLDEIERLQKEYDTSLKLMQSLYEPRIDELKAENERYRKALYRAKEEIEKYGSYAKALEIISQALENDRA